MCLLERIYSDNQNKYVNCCLDLQNISSPEIYALNDKLLFFLCFSSKSHKSISVHEYSLKTTVFTKSYCILEQTPYNEKRCDDFKNVHETFM